MFVSPMTAHTRHKGSWEKRRAHGSDRQQPGLRFFPLTLARDGDQATSQAQGNKAQKRGKHPLMKDRGCRARSWEPASPVPCSMRITCSGPLLQLYNEVTLALLTT